VTLAARLDDLLADVRPVDEGAAAAARDRHDRLVKPPGSMGRLEELGARLAAIAGRCPPPVPERPVVVVAAADHGVHAQGVTPWPQAVTTAMLGQLCGGTAAVNVLAAAVGASVTVLDVGCANEPPDHPRLRKARVRAGTADLTSGPAMTREEATRAVLSGAGVVEELAGAGADLVVPGDMGIANTTAGACLVAALTGAPPAAVTGRGAGDDTTLARKVAVVEAALARHAADADEPLAVLAALGGLEHAALAGVVLAAAAEGLPVVLDGLASNAAALAAAALCPPVVGYLVAGHRSPEPGAGACLAALGLPPLLDLGLRIGEGTGGALAIPLVRAAAAVLRDMGELSAVDS